MKLLQLINQFVDFRKFVNQFVLLSCHLVQLAQSISRLLQLGEFVGKVKQESVEIIWEIISETPGPKRNVSPYRYLYIYLYMHYIRHRALRVWCDRVVSSAFRLLLSDF